MPSLLRMHYSDIETRTRIARHERRIFHQAARGPACVSCVGCVWREQTHTDLRLETIGSFHATPHTRWLPASGNLEKFSLAPSHPRCAHTYIYIYMCYILYACIHICACGAQTYAHRHVGNGRTSKRRFEHASHTSGTRVYLTSLVPQNYPLKGRRYTG